MQNIFQTKRFKISMLAVLMIAIILFAYWLREIFIPVLLAALIAYILNPVVNFLEDKGLSRTWGVWCVFGAFILIALVFIGVAVPMIYSQCHELSVVLFGEDYTDSNENGKYDVGEAFIDSNGNSRYDSGRLSALLLGEEFKDDNGNGEYDADLGEKFTDINGNGKYDRGCLTLLITKLYWIMGDEALATGADAGKESKQKIAIGKIVERSIPAISEHLGAIAKTVRDLSVTITRNVFSGIKGITTLVSLVLLLPVYTFFILREMNAIRDKIIEYLPGQQRDRIVEILTKIHISVSSFFRGRLIVCICTASVTAIGLLICRVPFWLVIGTTVGIGGLIPFVGVLIGLIPACALAYFYNGPINVVFVILVFIITQAMEGFVFTPFILGHEIKMHPMTLIISIFIGGEILGLLGVLLAVPLVSILKILGEEFVLPSLKELASEGSSVVTAEGKSKAVRNS